jgi:hypothetical protein
MLNLRDYEIEDICFKLFKYLCKEKGYYRIKKSSVKERKKGIDLYFQVLEEVKCMTVHLVPPFPGDTDDIFKVLLPKKMTCHVIAKQLSKGFIVISWTLHLDHYLKENNNIIDITKYSELSTYLRFKKSLLEIYTCIL